MAHAKLYQPSKAHQWMECPGSLVITQGLPDEESDYAKWGSDAHRLAEICLTSEVAPEALLGRIMEHGSEVDEEMVLCVKEYVERVEDMRKGADSFYVETTLHFGPQVGINDPEEAFGSVDALVFKHGECQIHDLKTGKGVVVQAEGNPQMLLYALGAYHQYGPVEDMHRGVRLCVHQPRLGLYDEAWYSLDDLLAWREQVLLPAIEKCREAEAAPKDQDWASEYLSPGDKQCRFCRAKATCPALRGQVLSLVTDDFVPLDNPGSKLKDLTARIPNTDTKILAGLYPYLDLIQDWCSAVRAEVQNRVMAGELRDQYKIVEGRKGPRRWADEAAVKEVVKAAGLDVLVKETLASPTEAERLLKHGESWKKLQDFIVQAPGKPAVVPVSDPRPAIEQSDFKALED